MRFVRVGLVVLVLASVVAAQPPSTGPIRLPVRESPPAVVPANAPIALPAEYWYVIESDVECLLFASPGGAIAISKDAGPIRLRGRFVGGSGGVESKSFRGPFVYLVESAKAGRDELLILPVGAKQETDAKRVTFIVGPVPPKPDEPSEEVPIKADGLHVLIVYEPNKTLPAAQSAILTGQATRELLMKSCATDARGMAAFRVLPTGVEFGEELAIWKDAFARKRTITPWLIISNGKRGFEGPLPATERDFATLLAQFGGKP